MTPRTIQTLALSPALTLLPQMMQAREARVMLIAIALQESALRHRHQVGGAAHGFWQFESRGGTRGVLRHRATRHYALSLLDVLVYSPKTSHKTVHKLLEHNDVLAAGFARLLLWTLPDALPTHAAEGWEQYLEAWRPGRPHPGTWPANWRAAEESVY